MALLKAFVCQVILLGLYKLFLEQIFEDYLVPDELTRNCLVGFVSLLCFGIQLYTDKAADDDIDEAVEDLKATSNSRDVASTKKNESGEMIVTHEIVTETVGSNTKNRGMVTETQIISQRRAADSKIYPKDEKVIISKERSSAIPSAGDEKAIPVSNSGIFAQFATNMSDNIPNVKAYGMEEPEFYASVSSKQETTTNPVLNGLSDANVYEESDDEGIEIDHFETKESVQEVSAHLVTTEIEFIPEPATDTAAVSESLVSNKDNVFSTQNLEETTILKTNELAVEMVNGTNENLNNMDDISSQIEETESKKSVKHGDSQDLTLLSQPDERKKDTTESLPSTKEGSNVHSASIRAINTIDAGNKKNAEISPLVNATVPSTRQKMKPYGEVFVAPVTIDISFIYACH